jgi:hypothetical protein
MFMKKPEVKFWFLVAGCWLLVKITKRRIVYEEPGT